MKKKILLLSLSFFMLFSCNKKTALFDADFSQIIATLKNDSYAFNSLIPSESSEYVFSMNNINLKIRTYYKEYKDQFRYVFVLNFDYLNEDINAIRLAAICINESNSIVGQVGFNSDKKNISSFNDASKNTYKGLQIFLSPYIKDESIIRFYFECENHIGSFYQINNLKEYA